MKLGGNHSREGWIGNKTDRMWLDLIKACDRHAQNSQTIRNKRKSKEPKL